MPSKSKKASAPSPAVGLEAVLGVNIAETPVMPEAAAPVAVSVPEEEVKDAVTEPKPTKSRSKTKKAATASAADATVEGEAAPAPAPKKKSSSGSRTKAAAAAAPVSSATDDSASAATVPVRSEHVILQLQVPTPDAATSENAAASFETTFYRYDSILSTPNAFDEYDPFDSQPCLVSDETYQTSQHDIPAESPAPLKSAAAAAAAASAVASGTATTAPPTASKRKEPPPGPKTFDHMRDFMQRDEWPSTTNIVCFWCCHSFHNVPYGVPTKYVDEKFFVAGCFCSLECAAASVFYSQEIKHDTWASYHLLNVLARKLGYKALVKVAPPRTCLKMFGGYMDIADFRHYSETHKVIHSHSYPMVATIQQLEEVNDHENYSHRKSMFVPVDRQKLYMLENKIRLERNKPLLNSKNTLDYRMNLRLEGCNN